MRTRRCISLTLCAATFLLHAGQVTAAQQGPGNYPSRPMRVIVPFTPGGQPDIYTHLIQPLLVEAFGQPIIVDNRPGAGGMVGSRISKRGRKPFANSRSWPRAVVGENYR